MEVEAGVKVRCGAGRALGLHDVLCARDGARRRGGADAAGAVRARRVLRLPCAPPSMSALPSLTLRLAHAGNVLGPELVEQLTAASDASLGEQDASHFEDNVSSGSMILIDWDFFNSFVSPEPRRTPLRCFAREAALIPAILLRSRSSPTWWRSRASSRACRSWGSPSPSSGTAASSASRRTARSSTGAPHVQPAGQLMPLSSGRRVAQAQGRTLLERPGELDAGGDAGLPHVLPDRHVPRERLLACGARSRPAAQQSAVCVL